ncbi:HEAT repeat domain-containing protein [Bradyrhizobium macuxiense]|uniref:HEAT repeat domain-containing protein n=1 Tax=Bradyrhizobium macuxiense TaxID=1755647 RepID=UPI00142ECD49|nr:HEAT repeat domain-containing protein [Bradyrhizobium macuxiense]
MTDPKWKNWLETLAEDDETFGSEFYKGENDRYRSLSRIGDCIAQKIEELEPRDKIELIRRLSEDPRDDVRLAIASQLAAGGWTWLSADLRLELFEALGASQNSDVRRLVATALGNWIDPPTKLAAIAVLMGMRRADDASYKEADDGLKAVDDALFKLSGSV